LNEDLGDRENIGSAAVATQRAREERERRERDVEFWKTAKRDADAYNAVLRDLLGRMYAKLRVALPKVDAIISLAAVRARRDMYDGPSLAQEMKDVEALMGGSPAAHVYASTACRHGLHERCRESCKFCCAACCYGCHSSGR